LHDCRVVVIDGRKLESANMEWPSVTCVHTKYNEHASIGSKVTKG